MQRLRICDGGCPSVARGYGRQAGYAFGSRLSGIGAGSVAKAMPGRQGAQEINVWKAVWEPPGKIRNPQSEIPNRQRAYLSTDGKRRFALEDIVLRAFAFDVRQFGDEGVIGVLEPLAMDLQYFIPCRPETVGRRWQVVLDSGAQFR